MFEKYTLSKKLALTHFNTLPDGVLSSLGLRYLIRFYQFIYSSPLEKILTHKSSTCIITYDADTLLRRVIIGTLPSFILAIVPKLFNRQFRECLWSCEKYDNPSPQIAFMFSNEIKRGHGSELLRQIDISPLYVKTLSGGSAEKFYKKNGFKEYNTFVYAKMNYIMLIRY